MENINIDVCWDLLGLKGGVYICGRGMEQGGLGAGYGCDREVCSRDVESGWYAR